MQSAAFSGTPSGSHTAIPGNKSLNAVGEFRSRLVTKQSLRFRNVRPSQRDVAGLQFPLLTDQFASRGMFDGVYQFRKLHWVGVSKIENIEAQVRNPRRFISRCRHDAGDDVLYKCVVPAG